MGKCCVVKMSQISFREKDESEIFTDSDLKERSQYVLCSYHRESAKNTRLI